MVFARPRSRQGELENANDENIAEKWQVRKLVLTIARSLV